MIQLNFGKENSVPVTGANLSEGGLFCESTEHIEPYSRLYLMFELVLKDETRSICCEGIVVRSEKKNSHYMTGIEFSNIDEQDRIFLKKFIKENK